MPASSIWSARHEHSGDHPTDRCELRAICGRGFRNRVQLASDGLVTYLTAVEKTFGADADTRSK
ncbi:MAG TPA: hypothetical protein VHU79_01205 [Sphingomicrobium sp.]|nr:hypothetical protein [Sphingomicrobium sp.]